MWKLGVRVSAFVIGALISGMAIGQEYPSKPIRIVTLSIGGGADFVARLVAAGITAPLGQNVLIDNRPSGPIPGQVVSQAAPDGYTLLFIGPPLWVGSLLRKMPYDPVTDFAPISSAGRSPNILIVHPTLPVKSVKELIALAKAHPGELNYSGGSAGGSTHLSGELFKFMAGVNIVRIPYSSGNAELSDMITGQSQMTLGGIDQYMPHVNAGKLRALAVTTAKPTPLAPGLPPVAQTLPGYEVTGTTGMFAPARTPDAIIRKLNQEIVRYLNRSDTKERFLNSGLETAASTPEEFGALIKSDVAKFGRVIKEANIKAD